METKKRNRKSEEVIKALYKECYNTIYTLSIFAWYKIAETGDMTYLFKEKRDITNSEESTLEQLYKKIRAEYLKEFGWDEVTKTRIALMQEIVRRNMVLQATGDSQEYTFILIAMEKLEETTYEQSQDGLISSAITIERALKLPFPVDIYTCSVAKFFGYIKAVNNGR